MTLNIEVKGLSSEEATTVITACQKAINGIEDFRAMPPTDLSAERIEVTFSYDSKNEAVYRGEESTFTRYINSATSKTPYSSITQHL